MPEFFTPYEGSEPFVFVSYAHKDTDIVLPVIRGLHDRGVRVWYDGGLEVGTEWPDFIAEHLEASSCVIAFVSRNFGDSHNCRREINFAIEERKEPVVIYLEPKELLKAGMRMQLGSLHAMFYDRYENADVFLDALVKAAVMKSCIGATAEEVPVEPTPMPFDTIEFADEAETIPVSSPDVTKDEPPAETPEECYQKARKFYLEYRYEEAAVLYRKAAEQGHEAARYMLGTCYFYVDGVRKDAAEAVKCFRIAAEPKHAHKPFIGYNAKAQYWMGYCYENGFGVSKDLTEALLWYRKAKENGVFGFENVDKAIARCEKALKNPWWKK